MFRRLAASAAACAAAALCLGSGTPVSATPRSFDHVYVIMMENQSFDNLVGRNKVDPVSGNILAPDTPFITNAALQYGVATLYFGVTHPSLPNYLATIGGQYFGVQDDNSSCYATVPDAPCHKVDAPNLVDRLEAKNLSWTALEETMPSAGYLGTQYPGSAPRLYAQKHNPFVYFKDIVGKPERMAKIKPLDGGSLARTLAHPPNLTYIVPNQCHDMHGTTTCGNFDELLQAGDSYLKTLTTAIATSPTFTKNSAIFVIWDEDDYSSNLGCCSSLPSLGGGHTLALVYAAGAGPKRSATPMNHYSLLRTLLEGFHLAPLGHSSDANVSSMWDLF